MRNYFMLESRVEDTGFLSSGSYPAAILHSDSHYNTKKGQMLDYRCAIVCSLKLPFKPCDFRQKL